MRRTLLLLFLAGMAGCRSHQQEILGMDSMKVITWDMMKADEIYNRILSKDSMARKRHENLRLYEEVFALHHITRGKFDSSYKYYESHPLMYKALVDSLGAFSEREKSRFAENNHGQAH